MSEALEHPRYVPGALLGQGAQGTVLRVRDREAPERALVAKVWRGGGFPESALRGEFALLARLSLPFIVRVHDFGVDARSGSPFLVEDFVPGLDARAYVQEGPSEERSQRLWQVLTGALRALLHLHEAGFIHGDLKPAHVKVSAQGEVTLIDLGSAFARALSLGSVAGSPGYLAPELLAGAGASVASDLFALGALCFKAATGELPSATASNLRVRAPWVEPRLATLVSALLAPHPRDRPADAGEALSRLSLAGLRAPQLVGSLPFGRERELAELVESARGGVRYLSGPSGIGKTHLAREVWTQALLAGRDARLLTLPSEDEAHLGKLLSFFRGDPQAWPFTRRSAAETPLLLVLDPLERAPSELCEALEAFRCRGAEPSLTVLAVCREAPPGAPALTLAPLGEADFAALAARLGVTQKEELALAQGVGRGNPGWLVALRGGAPLTREMVLERVQALSPAARALLTSVALCAGSAPESLLARLPSDGPGSFEGLSELFTAGLLLRRIEAESVSFRLPSLAFSSELVANLATFELVDRMADALLAEPSAPAQQLLSVAQAPSAPARREQLLERAAHAARQAGLAGLEIEALLSLLANPEQRSAERLLRLERLTRDAGSPAGHPEVIAWLERAAALSPELAPLALRRRAERAARSGELETADGLIAQALSAAIARGDAAAEGFVHGSAAAIALYRADWPRAERELALAREKLSSQRNLDAEELARLEHNSGVVDLYAERFASAAERLTASLEIKRKLGDRGGVRSCLLNLGIALISIADFSRAESVLTEAIELARSLSQRAGEAWCLVARVELEVRRGAAQAAERWLALAEASGDAAPAVVRADLRLLEAQIALLNGDAERALSALSALDRELVAGDPSLQVKALLAEGEARLLLLPSEPRRAARLSLAALRLSRTARLGALAERAQKLLSLARRRAHAGNSRYRSRVDAERSAEWDFLHELGVGAAPSEAAHSLCRLFVSATRAERALFATVAASGEVASAFGVDLDGFELSNAKARFEPAFLRALLAAGHSLYQADVDGGSRLGAHAASPGGQRVVVLLEHRFRPGHFDALSAARLNQWLTLAQLAARFVPSASVAAPAPEPEPEATETSTRQPNRAARRQFPRILGDSPALKQALLRLDAAVDSALPVLVVGETGSGKELFARALHDHGARADRPFVAVNCAAIADSLFEAELFGHARGAFTGADRARAGLLAQAEGGTLLLDELGELSLARQATLLRLLETRAYRAVGSDAERQADVRFVAATNRDLDEEVEQGRFRRDLLFRLNVLKIRVPSLRERREDIPLLVRALLARAARPRTISEAALERLSGYDWPGNVRELENVVSRWLALGGERIDVPDLPRAIRAAAPRSAPAHGGGSPERSQREEVEHALLSANGNITRAAQLLGLTRHGLKKRMLRFGLRTRGESRG